MPNVPGFAVHAKAHLKHHGDRAYHGIGVSDFLSGNIRRGTMGGLIVGLIRPHAGRGHQAEGAQNAAPLVTQDVAEHIFHDHHVELSGIKTEVGGSSIHQDVLDLHVRKISADFLHDFIPKHARLENIALVNVM